MRNIIVLMMLAISLWAVNTQQLLQAYKEALNVYKMKDKDFYKSIEILRKAGMHKILDSKPKNMDKQDYINLLNDYGFFLSLTNDSNLYVLANYCEAKKVLEKVKELSPERVPIYLNLGDLYWKMYTTHSRIYSYNAMSVRHRYSNKGGDCFNRPDKPTFPYLAKQMYLEYEKRMKLLNKKNKIPKRIKFILENNKVFVLIRDYWPENRTETFNPCTDYITALNSLSEEERSYCNRDLSKASSDFKELPWSSLSEKNQERFYLNYRRGKAIHFQFKDWLYVDTKYTLYEKFKLEKDSYTKSCRYNFLDLNLKQNTHVTSRKCAKLGDKK